jgi:hypothetical protein
MSQHPPHTDYREPRPGWIDWTQLAWMAPALIVFAVLAILDAGWPVIIGWTVATGVVMEGLRWLTGRMIRRRRTADH